MKNLQQRLYDILLELCVDNSILIGLSGGVDSIVLSEILFRAGCRIELAHCHFNLRGDAADSDQKFAENYAKKLGVPFHTIVFDTQSYADQHQISIQMAARELRYEWFEKIRAERRLDKIAVGTHLSDNIETFLFNAVRGTGLKGLRGIKQENGNVIRPLIQISKQEIYDFAKTNELDWVEDQSNENVKYHRNKIRQDIVPHLKEINPNVEATFNRNFKRLGRLDAFVEQEVNRIWGTWVKRTGNIMEISISGIRENEFSDVILNRQLDAYGFNTTHVDDLLSIIESEQFVGKVIHSDRYEMRIDRNAIYLKSISEPIRNEGIMIGQDASEIQMPLPLELTKLEREGLNFEKEKSIAYFDIKKLRFPILLRKWAHGDRIHPFGMKGVKKVSDLLIDNKVPMHEKDNIWVLESDGEIIWVVGIRSSERFKVGPDCKDVYRIRAVQ